MQDCTQSQLLCRTEKLDYDYHTAMDLKHDHPSHLESSCAAPAPLPGFKLPPPPRSDEMKIALRSSGRMEHNRLSLVSQIEKMLSIDDPKILLFENSKDT